MNAQPRSIVNLVPPFTLETSIQKVRGPEDNSNSRNRELVTRGYSSDRYWRDRSEFPRGRTEVIALLTRKWPEELGFGKRIACFIGLWDGDPMTILG